jgi:hypothetical protein
VSTDGSALLAGRWDAPHNVALLQPEKRFHQCSGAETPRARRLLAEVTAWFFSDASDSPFAFVSLCEWLGLDPATFRRGIRRSGIRHLESAPTIRRVECGERHRLAITPRVRVA